LSLLEEEEEESEVEGLDLDLGAMVVCGCERGFGSWYDLWVVVDWEGCEACGCEGGGVGSRRRSAVGVE
jgi:hypothetical protein